MQVKTDLREFSVRMQENTWICQYAVRAIGHWKQTDWRFRVCFFGAVEGLQVIPRAQCCATRTTGLCWPQNHPDALPNVF